MKTETSPHEAHPSGGSVSEFVQPLAESCAGAVEIIGLAVITLFSIYAIGFAIGKIVARADQQTIFYETRHRLIRGVLLGLEFLVAADIIHTVAVELSFTSVGVLAIVVLIRTFLSFSLELEMTGRWPWQRDPTA